MILLMLTPLKSKGALFLNRSLSQVLSMFTSRMILFGALLNFGMNKVQVIEFRLILLAKVRCDCTKTAWSIFGLSLSDLIAGFTIVVFIFNYFLCSVE